MLDGPEPVKLDRIMIFTLCPGCYTVARVQAALLNAGELQCGRCGLRYAALGQLFDDALEAQAAALAVTAAAALKTVPVPVAAAPLVAPAPAPAAEPEPEPLAVPELVAPVPLAPLTGADWDAFGQPPLDRDLASSVASSAELDAEVRRQIEAALLAELTEPARRRVSGRTWLGLVVLLLLMLGLSGYWLYLQRAYWLDHPQWRPWADQACAILGCELPLRRDSSQIELLEREVRDHPRRAEAVLIRASFVNRASFPQPYPVFEVIFSDLVGNTLALHRFAPEDYLEDAAALAAGIASGQTAALRLEVPDPGRRAVSFQMDFR
jgi:hypothetical protein